MISGSPESMEVSVVPPLVIIVSSAVDCMEAPDGIVEGVYVRTLLPDLVIVVKVEIPVGMVTATPPVETTVWLSAPVPAGFPDAVARHPTGMPTPLLSICEMMHDCATACLSSQVEVRAIAWK